MPQTCFTDSKKGVLSHYLLEAHKDLQIRTWSLKINKLKLSLRISKRFILVTSLYHKRVSIGLLCKDEKCTIRNKCEIWIILICCYQSWKKLAIELLLNLLKNLSVKAFKKWLRNKNHPTSSFQKQQLYFYDFAS